MILCAVLVCVAVTAFAAGPTSQPTSADLTPRQQNLLLQLSDAEANIQAINKALVRTGYKVGLEYDRIDSELKANDLMDRNGGGPIRWDAFYGKTARSFYVPVSEAALHGESIGRRVDVRVAEGYHPIQRPRQFDYIYSANDQQIARARDQVAALVQDQTTLLARRQKHEADQSRLWATLAWDQVESRDIDLHPFCRFKLKPEGSATAVLRPVIVFLRTADRVAADGLVSVEGDQGATFQAGAQRMETAFSGLRGSLADALDAKDLRPDQQKAGQTLKSLCKELAEECKVISDNYANALDRDQAKQDTSKLEFRAQLQTSLAQFATATAQLDEEVTKAVSGWGIEADKGTPAVDTVIPAPVIKVGRVNPTLGAQPAPQAGRAALPPIGDEKRSPNGENPPAAQMPAMGELHFNDGKWSRRFTQGVANKNEELRVQVYEVFDGGKRVRAFSWDLPFLREDDGSLSITGSHFFQTFTRTPKEIAVREWKNRADYTAGKPPIYAGSFEPLAGQTASPGPANAQLPQLPSVHPDDWRVWCWSTKQKQWSEYPLSKMTAQTENGVLRARNTTGSNWKRAILLYRTLIPAGDFDISVEFRGSVESFDLQSAKGDNTYIDALVGSDAQSGWHKAEMLRRGRDVSAAVDDMPAKLEFSEGASNSLVGYFCFKLHPNDEIEIRNFRFQGGSSSQKVGKAGRP
jgi:hypothetical protein